MINELQQLAGVAGKSVLASLDCLHYDGNGTFTASDLKNTLSISGLEIGIDTPFCVDAKNLVSILKGFGSKEVEMALGNNILGFKSGRSKYKLPTLPPEDFPELVRVEEGEGIIVPASVMRTVIQDTLFAVSKNDTRVALTGIKFDDNKVVATDGQKMSMVDSQMSFNFILPASSARIILSSLDGDIRVTENERFIQFASGNAVLTVTKIDQRFPDWQAVVPQNTPHSLTVKVETISEAVARLLQVSNKTTSAVIFNLADTVTLESEDIDFKTSGTEELDCVYEGEPMRISFNGAFLLETLKTISDESIKIGFVAPNRAAMLRAEGREALLMPMAMI